MGLESLQSPFKYGFGYVWVAQEVGTVNAFIEQFKL